MNRFFSIFNAVGVAALALICLLQWRQIGRLETDVLTATDNANAQAVALAREKTAHAQAESDLSDLRDRLAAANAETDSARARAVTAGQAVNTVTAELKSYKLLAARWQAVAEQQQSAVRLFKSHQDDTTAKYNDLASKYNALVKSSGG